MILRAVMLTIALALLLAGCNSSESQAPVEQASEKVEPSVEQVDPPKSEPPKPPPVEPAPTPKPATSPTPAPLPPPPPPSPPDQLRGSYDATATVKRVTDGDTLDISPAIDGVEDVRLIGPDTPETKKPGCAVAEPYGREAYAFTKSEIEGRRVGVEFDRERQDRYGRLLAYVYEVDGDMLNEVLIEEGYAQVLVIAPNDRYADRFYAAQNEARAAGKGIWGLPPDQLAQLKDRGNGIGGAGCGGGAKSEEPRKAPSSPPGGAGGDRDCSDFSSKAEASQAMRPGDPDGLDKDGDSLACESLP
jgi:micrococcal nuclease